MCTARLVQPPRGSFFTQTLAPTVWMEPPLTKTTDNPAAPRCAYLLMLLHIKTGLVITAAKPPGTTCTNSIDMGYWACVQR